MFKHHMDVAVAFSYNLANNLFFHIGLKFSANFSFANLASLVHKHRAVLNKSRGACL